MFTYDIATNVGKVRALVADTTNSPVAASFQDEEIQAFLDLNSGSVYLACANCCDRQAIVFAGQPSQQRLGDYVVAFRGSDTTLQEQAKRFRDLEYNTPAFAAVEENLSNMNAIAIIRNWILRNEGP